MKKNILILIITLSTLTISAQKIKYGIKGGLNLASAPNSNVTTSDVRTSFHFGVIAELALSKKISIQTELLYSSQGSKHRYFNDTTINDLAFQFSRRTIEEEENIIRLNYLNLPILFKYNIIKGLSLEAGPQIGLLLSAKKEYSYLSDAEFEINDKSIIIKDNIKDNIESLDYGVNFGLGYKLSNHLNLSLRYYIGLSNVNNGGLIFGPQSYDFFSGTTISSVPIELTNKNRTLQISLNYIF